MNFGYFDDTNKEYVITTPQTPLPWINYLGCESFFRLISNTGGGVLPDTAITMHRQTATATTTISKTAAPYGILAGSRHRPHWMLMNAATVLDIRFTKVLKMNWKPV